MVQSHHVSESRGGRSTRPEDVSAEPPLHRISCAVATLRSQPKGMPSSFLTSLVVITGVVGSVTLAGVVGVFLLATTESLAQLLRTSQVDAAGSAAMRFYWAAISPSSPNPRTRRRLVALLTALIVFVPAGLPPGPLSFNFVP